MLLYLINLTSKATIVKRIFNFFLSKSVYFIYFLYFCNLKH
jgi:hypothetical protein